jgi:hypothetical protein
MWGVMKSVERGSKRGGKKMGRQTFNIVDFAKYHSKLAAASNSIGEFIVVVNGLRAPHMSQGYLGGLGK